MNQDRRCPIKSLAWYNDKNESNHIKKNSIITNSY